jgi:hypothetical protein
MQTFDCDHCGQGVFFEDTFCEACGHALGYLSEQRRMSALEEAPDGLWLALRADSAGRLYRKCRNYELEDVCNWMLVAADPNSLCASCRLTEIIPTLSVPADRNCWYRLEQAKRRLIYTLSALGLAFPTKAEDPARGLAFRFLADSVQTGTVVTGHDGGVITLNIAEADDALRESTRAKLGEPYRTLLGHFRHEIGHYYWDCLIAKGSELAAFRQVFGDERADYANSLGQHYAQGPPANWPQHFVSAYASAHPWEDWAETWAQYLQMIDALETVQTCGMALMPTNPDDPSLAHGGAPGVPLSFEQMLGRWHPLRYLLNNLQRSLGMPDTCQFSLLTPVVGKLRFVHELLNAGA